MGLMVNEIFLSLQGEGLNQGLPTVFVRLQGCNLTPDFCSYCDTKYAQKSGGTEMTTEEIISQIVKLSPYVKTRVCITGGEPLFQEEGLEELVAKLNKFNYYIEIFTNGTCPRPDWYTRVNSWVVDIKMPSANLKKEACDEWLDSRASDQIKLTVGSEEDLLFAERIIASMVFRAPKVIVSPVIRLQSQGNQDWDIGSLDNLWLQRVAKFVTEHPCTRYSLQTQKVIWGNKKGV